MTKILACIDASPYRAGVCDLAAWAAGRLGAPVEIVHTLGRRELPSLPLDLGTGFGVGVSETLMAELAELDQKKARLASARGNHLLDDAAARLREQGVEAPLARLRQGDVADTVRDLTDDTRLIVIGQRGEAADFARGHMGSNLERVVRAAKRPILTAPRETRPIERMLLAFDGGRSAMAIVERMVQSPLLKGVACDLLLVGMPTGEAAERLREAERALRAAGYDLRTFIEEGEPSEAIATRIHRNSIDLLVMGAYGHSRIRNLIVGSTTTELLQSCDIPVLVMR